MYLKIIFLSYFFICSFLAYSMDILQEDCIVNDKKNAKVLTRNDLLSGKCFDNPEIILSGTFSENDFESINSKMFTNVQAFSLEFVNQPTFGTESIRQKFFNGLNSLSKLERLSLKNQLFVDEHLVSIPKSVKIIDLSNTGVLGYGLEHLQQGTKVVGIEDSHGEF